MQGLCGQDETGNDADGTRRHTPQEIGDLLRSVDFALDHATTALIAFGDRRYIDAIGRDVARIQRSRDLIAETLKRLPDAIPPTPEELEKAGRVVGAVLDKRFGEGSQAAVDEAIADWVER